MGVASVTLATDASRRPVPVSGLSVGDYLIRRLSDYGVRDIFGIPGDYVLRSTRCSKRARCG